MPVEKDSATSSLLSQITYLKESYRMSDTRLLIFDYDGTLTPIVQDPAMAKLPPHVHVLLKKLASDRKNKVWIVSGRDKEFLEREFSPCPNLGLAAEHGAFFREPFSSIWNNMIATPKMDWRMDAAPMLAGLIRLLPNTWIETKASGLVWHFRGNELEGDTIAPAAFRLIESRARRCNWPVQVMEGKCVLEVRADAVNKGTAVGFILATAKHGRGSDPMPKFVLCAGDDKTDEDMFAAIDSLDMGSNYLFSTHVRDQADYLCTETRARYHLQNPKEVWQLLAEMDRGEGPPLIVQDLEG